MARAADVLAALVLIAAPLSACTLLRPLHGLTCEPGAGNASCLYGDACQSDADCATTSCAGAVCQCPDDMVAIESTFCIDRAEVSNAAYEKFLAKHPRAADQEAFCAWNDDFGFDTEPDSCKTRRTGGDYPASCVDWCDARAYCQSIGKRLCGAIHGGPNPEKDLAKAGVSEWYTACSKGGALAYPTDGVYDPAQCNGDSNAAVPVGTPGMEVCEGGYLGLMHMSGNVREWEDSCSGSTGAEDQCLTRGGAFDSGTTSDGSWSLLSCAVDDPRARDDTDATIGFRCCSG